jgi:phosphoenolpyruvate carboxykinase (ATP)
MAIPVSAQMIPRHKLLQIGLKNTDSIHYQSSVEELVAATLRHKEGELNDTGALVIETGKFTGRSPKDKFIVRDNFSENLVHWNDFNIPISEKYFDTIFRNVTEYLGSRNELWIRDCYACADPSFRLNVRVINEKPANNLFAYNMFLRPAEDELSDFLPQWHVLSAPGLRLDPDEAGTRDTHAAVISFRHRTIIIAGTGYTGEMKKGIFTILNLVLPIEKNVLSMHCSANMGDNGDTALFFGLSGTGKTTLSADPLRKLIGDDEHGWHSEGIFNFEGGCYAKCIDLTEEKEPEIFNAIRPGALVENTCFFPGTNTIDFSDASITENTRVSYPIHHISNAIEPSVGGHPKNIFFLTCDAYGVLPPISKLSAEQAMYQFISGYTAKVAGTETGVTEPKATFSACFGAPFLPLHPGKYAHMLGEKMEKSNARVWLINTGWTGGPYGKGTRMKLSYTRAMITAAMQGNLDEVEYEHMPVFGLSIPVSCPGVPSELLNPRTTWENKEAYDRQSLDLAKLFVKNFEKYASGVSANIVAAAPSI